MFNYEGYYSRNKNKLDFTELETFYARNKDKSEFDLNQVLFDIAQCYPLHPDQKENLSRDDFWYLLSQHAQQPQQNENSNLHGGKSEINLPTPVSQIPFKKALNDSADLQKFVRKRQVFYKFNQEHKKKLTGEDLFEFYLKVKELFDLNDFLKHLSTYYPENKNDNNLTRDDFWRILVEYVPEQLRPKKISSEDILEDEPNIKNENDAEKKKREFFNVLVNNPSFQKASDEFQLEKIRIKECQLEVAEKEAKVFALIDKYLATQKDLVGTAISQKHSFFTRMKDGIKVGSFHFGMIKQLLEKKDELEDRAITTNDLFANSLGSRFSGTLRLIARLYRTVTGITLSKTEKKQVRDKLEFPKRTLFVDQLLENPYLKPINKIQKEIQEEFSKFLTSKSRQINKLPLQAQFHLNSPESDRQLKEQARYEALYQQKIIQRALKHSIRKFRFDPQGRALIEVRLSDADYIDIAKRFDPIKNNEINSNDAKLIFARYTGENIEVHPTIFCSLDVRQHKKLETGFQNKFGAHVYSALKGSKFFNSIIPLQEEIEMHMRLTLRGILAQGNFDDQSIKLLNKACLEALKEINKNVLAVYTTSLIKLRISGKSLDIDDIKKLNVLLDKERMPLAIAGNKLLVKTIYDKLVLKNTKEANKFLELIKSLNSYIFEKVTATGHSYLATDSLTQSCTRISATNHTAHDKKEKQQALRLVFRNHYRKGAAEQYHVTPFDEPHIEGRVPSIALKKLFHKPAIADVKVKLDESRAQLTRTFSNVYHGPIVYNLLTSLNSKFYDWTIDGKNRQRKSAARILHGAHLYNKGKIQNENFWLVQNIAVNQHTNHLKYDSSDDATAEATVMAELALLFTLSKKVPEAIRNTLYKSYRNVVEHYKTFLNSKTETQVGDHYFKDSMHGKRAIQEFKRFKAIFAPQLEVPEINKMSFSQRAALALVKIMAHNLHWDKQYGMLVQALSVFLEPLSQAGCKSADERYAAMAGRVEMLHFFRRNEADLKQAEQNSDIKFIYDLALNLENAFKAIIQATENDIKKNTTALQTALDKCYNIHLYGPMKNISLEDQGGPWKLLASKSKEEGIVSEFFNQNYGEPETLTSLSSNKYASFMQAHKNPRKEVQQVAKEINKSLKPK